MPETPAMPAIDPVTAGIQAAQTAIGLIQTISANAKIKKLMGQRVGYKTPKEIFKLLNASKSLASQGFDPATLSYMNSQVDRDMGATLGVATRLGANPNQLSAIFDQAIQARMKIGAANHAKNLENFGKYMGALEVVAANDAAEQKSRDDMIKDQIQAAAGNKNQGAQNIGNAFNSFLSAYASGKIGQLYLPKSGPTPTTTTATSMPTVGLNTDWLLQNNPYSAINN